MNHHERTARRWKFLLIFLLLLILRHILDLFFQDVAPTYSSTFGNPLNLARIRTSRWLFVPYALLVALIAAYKSTTLSTLCTMTFIMNGISTFCLYAYKSTITDDSFYASCLFWAVFILCAALPPLHYDSHTRTLSIRRGYRTIAPPAEVSPATPQKSRSTLLTAILLVSFLSAVALSGIYGDFRLFIDFSDVYSYRFEFIEASLPSLVSYFLRFLSGAILPFLFAAFLSSRQRGFAALALLGGLFTYGIDGLKTTLLIYVIIFFFYVIIGRKKKQGICSHAIILFLLTLVIGIFVVHLIFTRYNTRFFSTEIYRVMVVPASIGDNYYQFIRDGEPLLLSQSILRAFIDSPYEKSIYYMVTTQTQSGHAAIANTGLFGDAYANFKMVGVLVYPLLYCLVFKVWETLTRKESPFLAVSIGFVIIWNAISLSFFTWLLSGGVIIFCLLITAKNKLRLRIT